MLYYQIKNIPFHIGFPSYSYRSLCFSAAIRGWERGGPSHFAGMIHQVENVTREKSMVIEMKSLISRGRS